MFLAELIVGFYCLAFFIWDVKLAFECYEKYVTLPRLRQDRQVFLDAAYAEVALDRRKALKRINSRIASLNRKRRVQTGVRIIMAGDVHFGSRYQKQVA
jgi:hypothetical protein